MMFTKLLCRYSGGLLGIPVALGLCAIQAYAVPVLNINVVPVSVAAGTNGAAIDIDITNNTGTSQTLSAFSVYFSVGDAHITFLNTGNETATVAAYVYAGNSFDFINGVPVNGLANGQAVEASDLPNNGTAATLSNGLSYGLAHIFFNVAGNTTPGTYQVTIGTTCANPNVCTSLSDAAFNNLGFGTTNANITVTAGTGTPEPSTFLLGLTGLPLLALLRKRIA